MVDWKLPENNERLLACWYLSMEEAGGKINYKRVAELFGQGTTGNAIECNFRKIRTAAKAIKSEVENNSTGNGGPVSAPVTPRKPKTPKKDPTSGVKSGRVEKATPSKKNIQVKVEQMDDFGSSDGFTEGALYDEA